MFFFSNTPRLLRIRRHRVRIEISEAIVDGIARHCFLCSASIRKLNSQEIKAALTDGGSMKRRLLRVCCTVYLIVCLTGSAFTQNGGPSITNNLVIISGTVDTVSNRVTLTGA